MRDADHRKLRPGDLIRHKTSGDALVVTANYGSRATAVRTYDITNPREWDCVDEGGRVISTDEPERGGESSRVTAS